MCYLVVRDLNLSHRFLESLFFFPLHLLELLYFQQLDGFEIDLRSRFMTLFALFLNIPSFVDLLD